MLMPYSQANFWLAQCHKLLKPISGKNHIIICPSFETLTTAKNILELCHCQLGAQECSPHSIGAYTGQVSAQSLHEIGCTFCLVGHSEQRADQPSYDVYNRIAALLSQHITPIACISEVSQEYLAPIQQALKTFSQQLIYIAYEPIGAIGTGSAALPEEIGKTISSIRHIITDINHTPILYGGSVAPNNISALKKIKGLSGFLVGSASTNIATFAALMDN